MRMGFVAALAALALPASASGAPPRLTTGFFDSVFTAGADLRDPWLLRTTQAGAQIVRIDAGWATSADRPPDRPTDPASPGYDFTQADDAVRAAREHGLEVLLSFSGAPRWAEGPGRPAGAPPGSWRPDPHAVGAYGEALARRYSGAFPDPQRPGETLPRVRFFQAWNEPNLEKYLSPQWVRRGKHIVPAAPAHYRRMLNAFYAGVHRAQPTATVVTAGTAPFGDPPGARRMPPARFVRELLCFRDRRLHLARCPDPAHFDALSHHPYSIGPPARRALNVDDVSIPDIAKLRGPLRRAERTGRALPHVHKQLWSTEVSFDSSPPDPRGVPVAEQARWLEQTFELLWRQGVSTVTWFLVRDEAPVPSYGATNQAGVYFRDGRAKPSMRAFRFPFVVRHAGRRLVAWTRAPAGGTLVVERRAADGWRPVLRTRVAAGSVLQRRLRGRGGRLRARVAGETSLTWSIRR